MGEQTLISWSSATWNPWQGCRRKSEGCRFCYMFRDMKRYGKDPMHIHRSADATFRKPLQWQRQVERGERQDREVFTCSWSDWFIKEADAWRLDGWKIIRDCPDLIFQILTKRADRMADNLPPFWDEIRDHCWLGVSAEDQKNYDLRRPYVDQPLAPVMWWSLEPLLGPIDPRFGSYAHKPAWVVIGGESGNDEGEFQARPFNAQWAYELIHDCSAHKIPVHMKQFGSRPYWIAVAPKDIPSGRYLQPERREIKLKDRHGANPAEWPQWARVREFPTAATGAPTP